MKNLLLIAIILSSISASAQEIDHTGRDFIKGDSISYYQVTIVNPNSKKRFEQVSFTDGSGKLRTLYPHEVNAYMVFPYDMYYSKEIGLNDSIRNVFVETIKLGEKNLYKYINKQTYYILEDSISSETTVLEEDDYKQKLRQVFGEIASDSISPLIENLRFRDKTIMRFLERLEEGNYKRLELPELTLEAGLVSTTFSPPNSSVLELPDLNDLNYGFGLQANLPLGHSSVSLSTGAFFNRYRISGSLPEQDTSYYQFNASQLQFPLSVRYTVPGNRVRPYFSGGIRLSQMLSESHNRVVKVTSDSLVQYNLMNTEALNSSLWHVGTAIGVEFDVDPGRVLYLEMRYYYHLARKETEFIRNDFNFVVGFSL